MVAIFGILLICIKKELIDKGSEKLVDNNSQNVVNCIYCNEAIRLVNLKELEQGLRLKCQACGFTIYVEDGYFQKE